MAGLAGITKGYLSMLETGEHPLNGLKLIVALAGALEISPSELTRMPLPAPGDGNTNAATEAVRRALDAIDVGRPGGGPMPLEILRERVAQLQRKSRACQFADVAADLSNSAPMSLSPPRSAHTNPAVYRQPPTSSAHSTYGNDRSPASV